MREHIYRGKRIDNREWTEGLLIKLTPTRYAITDEYPSINNRFIAPSDNCKKADIRFHEVDPDTVGEFTGLLDKNGVRIFEGDKIYNDYMLQYCTEKDDEKFAVIEWDKVNGRYIGNMRTTCFNLQACHFIECEVIGSIHDNSELLTETT